MVIYADILFINNTIMTLAIIWAVARILNYEYRLWRLVLAAIIGSVYTFIVYLVDVSSLSLLFRLGWHLGLNLVTAYVITVTAFGSLSPGKLIKTAAYLYLISFITVGTVLSLFNIYGINIFAGNGLVKAGVGLIVIFYLAKYGWYIFHKYRLPDKLYLPVTVEIEDRKKDFVGLVDTGNQLHDPLTDEPVLVIGIDDFKYLLPPEMEENCRTGEVLDLAAKFEQIGWARRIRVLPFSDLGQEHGLLIGIRPDRVIMEYEGDEINTGQVLLALTER
ncbi:MAG: sigma-E processing peptidase SpoIIGA, partial [Halanaerobiales bacterium]